jgi:catechol 2,3-dioxygenase-like lactoylglutathione lyase family enzyme
MRRDSAPSATRLRPGAYSSCRDRSGLFRHHTERQRDPRRRHQPRWLGCPSLRDSAKRRLQYMRSCRDERATRTCDTLTAVLSSTFGVPVLATSDIIAFAPTTDLARARSFYEDVLGLPVADENAYACVLNAHGTMLRVTAVAEVAHPGYTVLGWRVTDISETVTGLKSLGVIFVRYDDMELDAEGVWTSPSGDRIAWFTDPDGNVLSLTQFN